MSVILLCCGRNSVMLLSPISCNKNVKTKMQIWSCHRKTLYLQKISCTRNALRSMSKNIRLGLAVKLTNSVLEEERKEMSDEAYTEEMLNKFFGKWEGNETAEELMGIIKQNSSSSEPISFEGV